MITLDVNEYCHECSQFIPKAVMLTANGSAIQTCVKCQNEEMCHEIYMTAQRNLMRKAVEECQDS